MIFELKDPDKAYISNYLLLPRDKVAIQPIKSALTFIHGEEIVVNAYGELEETRPRKIRLWDETMHHLVVPREFIPVEKYKDYDFEFVDITPVDYPAVEVEDRIKLRDDNQLNAYRALSSHASGTLNLACGKGKTVLALKLIAGLGVPALIVVNTTALLEQWKKEVQDHLGLKDTGTIQGEDIDWDHPVTVAMLHTLSQRRESWTQDFRRHFGVVIYDEAHHVSAPTFVRSADLFYGRRISLTATASRLDRLEAIYQYHLGRVIHVDLDQDLIPHTIFHKLDWEFNEDHASEVNDAYGQKHMSRIRAYLGSLNWRNDIIYELALEDLKEGRNILILSHSVEHINTMCKELLYLCINAGAITGKIKQNIRLKILNGCNPVLGTFQLAREGLDKPELDTLYIVTPFSSPNDVQQAWGRIQRKYDRKQSPRVRVFEDLAFSRCKSSCKSLRTTLSKINYPYTVKTIKKEVVSCK